MTQAAERDQRAEAARAFIAGRLVRHRGLVVAVVCAALLNAGLVAAVVSWAAGYTKAGLVALVVIAVLVVATTVVTSASLGRAADRDRAEVAPRKIEAAVAHCSERLGIDAPRVRVVDDKALNAFAVGFGRNATVVFTSGLVELLEGREKNGDDLLEAVTTHELTGLAVHGSTLTHLSYCLLGWALVVLDCVGVLVAFLWVSGRSFLEADPTITRYAGQSRDDDIVTHLIVVVLTKLIGLALIAAAGLVLLAGSALWSFSGITRRWMIGRRVYDADALAAHLTGRQPELERMLRLLKPPAPTTPAHGGEVVEELCFVGPLPRHTYKDWTEYLSPHPSVDRRIERLGDTESRHALAWLGLAGPLVVSCMFLALLGGLGTLALQLPFDKPPESSTVAGAPRPEVPAPPVTTSTGTTSAPITREPGDGDRKPKSTVSPTASAPPEAVTPSSPTSSSSAPTTSTPPPNAPDRPELNTLTQDRWNHFCTQWFGVPARFGQDAYDVGCVGVDRAFDTVTDVCEAEFPDTTPTIDRIADFNDPLSWGCVAHADLLGAFQLSEQLLERQTGRPVTYHSDVTPRAYGYTYEDGSPIALDQLCAQTHDTPALDRILNMYDAHTTVECYRSAS